MKRPVDMGVKGKARATFSFSWAFSFPFALGSKKGTGPVSHEPSGVLYTPAPSNRGVIIPPGHSLFAAHVKGVGTPGALPRFVPTHAGVEANVGVAATGGGNARSASRASTGVPKPSSWACGRGRHPGSAGGGWLATRVEKRNEDLRLRFGNMSRELVPVDSWRARRRRSGRRARGTWWPRRRPSRATGVTTPPRDNTLCRSRRASREKVRPRVPKWPWRAQRSSFGFREISEETHAGGRKARVPQSRSRGVGAWGRGAR